MQRLEFSGAGRSLYGSLGVKRLINVMLILGLPQDAFIASSMMGNCSWMVGSL